MTALRTIGAARDGLGMHVVGMLDDDGSKRNQVLRGIKVLGTIDELPEIARATGAHRLLIALPSAPGDVIRRAVADATRLGLETRTVPALDELVSGRLGAAAIREVEVTDLLRRDPVVMDEPGLRSFMSGRTVLVTGAGGSIGSELSRQVFDLDPARLVLLDRAEGPLYDIDRELALLAGRDSGTATRDGRTRAELVTRLANVAAVDAMTRILAEDRPVMVLHAAAYKHVPMMENHPADAVYTNVGGTLSTVRASLAAGVERFVLVSTDKAVSPSSVMGATKRLAELAVAEIARASGRRYVAVRFGNVLGSSGSVVPLFQRQLREGVPLTITDPEMTRFFMTIPEASRLILEASLLGEPGDLFVLDMGEPVRIVDLARDLARLAGRDPDSVPIQYIGLRPGEKLHELLFYDAESIEPTRHAKVLRARDGGPPPAGVDVLAELDALVAVAETGDHPAARAALEATMARLQPAAAEVAVVSGSTDEPIPFHRPPLGAGEREAVLEVLDLAWLTTGARTAAFETAFAAYVGTAHAVAVNSATAALHLALEGLGVQRDDEVIVPTYTFAASAEVVQYLGARPILVDVDPRTANLDPGAVAAAVGPRTRAVEAVHIAGLPADLAGILGAAGSIPVVEDVAHAFPSPIPSLGGRFAGTIGRAGAFSFYATKTLTTGEGGMLATDDPALADRARTMRLHGIGRDAWKRYTAAGTWYYEIEAAGFKDNLTDLAAAIGLVQLQRAVELRTARAAIAARYVDGFAPLARDGRLVLPATGSADEHAWHLFIVRLGDGATQDAVVDLDLPGVAGLPAPLRAIASRRARAIDALREAGIGTSVHFIPLHLHPLYRRMGYRIGQFPAAEAAYAGAISLPIWPGMDDTQVARVVDAVTAAVGR